LRPPSGGYLQPERDLFVAVARGGASAARAVGAGERARNRAAVGRQRDAVVSLVMASLWDCWEDGRSRRKDAGDWRSRTHTKSRAPSPDGACQRVELTVEMLP